MKVEGIVKGGTRQTSDLSETESQDSSKCLCFYCPFAFHSFMTWAKCECIYRCTNAQIEVCMHTHMHEREEIERPP